MKCLVIAMGDSDVLFFCRFDECGLSPQTVKALSSAGYVHMTRVQEASLSICLEGMLPFALRSIQFLFSIYCCCCDYLVFILLNLCMLMFLHYSILFLKCTLFESSLSLLLVIVR